MARDNYSYRKYLREQAKRKKKEEKMQRKLCKKNMNIADETPQVLNAGTPDGQTNQV